MFFYPDPLYLGLAELLKYIYIYVPHDHSANQLNNQSYHVLPDPKPVCASLFLHLPPGPFHASLSTMSLLVLVSLLVSQSSPKGLQVNTQTQPFWGWNFDLH